MTRRKPSLAALAAGVNLSRANPSSVRENSADIFCDSLGLGDKIYSTHRKEFEREIKRSNERGKFATDFCGKFDGEPFKTVAKSKFKNEAPAKILGASQAKFGSTISLKREPFLLKKLTKQAVRTANQALQEVKFSSSASSKIVARAAKNSGMLAKFNANLLQNRQARRLILSKFDEIFKKSATDICVEFCKFVKSSARQIRLFLSAKPSLTAAKADENQNAKSNQSTDKAFKIVQTPSVEPSKAAFANLLKYAKTNAVNLPKRQMRAKTNRANLTRSERSEAGVKFSFKFNQKALK